MTANPNANIGIEVGYTRNSVRLPGGSFDADIGRFRLTLAASTRVVGNALIQYNSLRNDLLANIRINVIHRPGSDIFLVFTEQRGNPTTLRELQNRGAVAKVTFLTRI